MNAIPVELYPRLIERRLWMPRWCKMPALSTVEALALVVPTSGPVAGADQNHIWATAPLAAKSTRAWIDVEARKAERPSDHTLVVAEFAL